MTILSSQTAPSFHRDVEKQCLCLRTMELISPIFLLSSFLPNSESSAHSGGAGASTARTSTPQDHSLDPPRHMPPVSISRIPDCSDVSFFPDVPFIWSTSAPTRRRDLTGPAGVGEGGFIYSLRKTKHSLTSSLNTFLCPFEFGFASCLPDSSL